MAATRTQVYLTRGQRDRLDEIRRRDGRTLAEVIREAVDQYIEQSGESIEEAWEATRGSMPELEAPSRDEWDRGYG
jgi:predicted DNA-binding protein